MTEQDIIAGLRELGVRRGDELEVHASLHSFGIWDVVSLYEHALKTDPFGLYGLSK